MENDIGNEWLEKFHKIGQDPSRVVMKIIKESNKYREGGGAASREIWKDWCWLIGREWHWKRVTGGSSQGRPRATQGYGVNS